MSVGRTGRVLVALVAVAAAVAAGCGSKPSDAFDRNLSSKLPDAGVLNAQGFSLHARATETIGPTTGDLKEGALFWVGTRQGVPGVRSFTLAGSEGNAAFSAIDLVLYDNGDPSTAHAFWVQNPPEVAHRPWAVNLDNSAEFVAAHVDGWRFPWAATRPAAESSGVCLTSASPQLAARYCSGFHGWVLFCHWTMEIQLSAQDLPINDPRVVELFEAVTKHVADALACT